MKEISVEKVNELRGAYEQDVQARIVRNALKMNGIETISRTLESDIENPNVFSIDLATRKVTNQKKSGRCWIFSTMNVLRNKIADRYGIEELELSQNYVAFYDKLEKSNWFMECILSEIDSCVDSDYMRYLLTTAVDDGGQWDMIVSLIKKYGIAPKTAMPETFQSSNTGHMNRVLNLRLKKFAKDARNLHKEGKDEGLVALKDEALKDVYSLIASCFGLPPKTFSFEYRDKDKKFHAHYNITPIEFYEEFLKEDLDEYVTIIHAPTSDKPYYKTYTVKYLGNVVKGNTIKYLNLPMEEMKKIIIKQMEDGDMVWFGCDCMAFMDRESGLWDDKQFDYGTTFNMNLDMSKEEMLDYRLSCMNHAMVLDGVNLVDGKPNRWKIENSWGDKTANEGFYICSDSWFDKFVYEAAVSKKYLSKEMLEALEEEPKELQPWDPFGSLAD